jgi:hypothetical protein
MADDSKRLSKTYGLGAGAGAGAGAGGEAREDGAEYLHGDGGGAGEMTPRFFTGVRGETRDHLRPAVEGGWRNLPEKRRRGRTEGEDSGWRRAGGDDEPNRMPLGATPARHSARQKKPLESGQ